MSRLSELLKTRSTPANSANPANLGISNNGNSQDSQDSQQAQVKLRLTADFEARYRAMCSRWRYDPADVLEGIEAARKDPAKAWLTVLADERRTQEERDRWMCDA